MSTDKFDDMVARESLFFTRLRHMMDVVDPREGQPADINFKSPDVNVDWFLNEVLAPGQPPEVVDSVRRQFSDPVELRRTQEWGRDNTYINCWYIDEFESQAMWDAFVSTGDGVVVHSSIRNLQRAFHKAAGGVCIQPVIYYDPQGPRLVPVDAFHTPLYKSQDHSHEQELRCFEVAPQTHGTYDVFPPASDFEHWIGVFVPVDLQALIVRVRTAPNAALDLLEHVRSRLEASGVQHVVVEPSKLAHHVI